MIYQYQWRVKHLLIDPNIPTIFKQDCVECAVEDFLEGLALLRVEWFNIIDQLLIFKSFLAFQLLKDKLIEAVQTVGAVRLNVKDWLTYSIQQQIDDLNNQILVKLEEKELQVVIKEMESHWEHLSLNLLVAFELRVLLTANRVED